MKYCYKCGTKLSDEMVFCHSCGERAVVNNISNESLNHVEIPKPAIVCEPYVPIPKKRRAMGIVGMILGYVVFVFLLPLTLVSFFTLGSGATILSRVVFWVCAIPSLIMTILSTIFSFISRHKSGFKNQITSRGIICSIINWGFLIFAILVYILVK